MSMKKWLFGIAAATALMSSATPAQAFFWGGPNCVVILNWSGYDVYPPGTTFQKQIVTCYYPHWYQQQVPTVVPRTTYKIENTPVRTYVHVPKVVEERQTYLTYVPIARLVEKEVTTCVMLPMIVNDPTGSPFLTIRPEIRTHTVRHAVHDLQPVLKETMVKVTKMVPVERETIHQQVVPIVTYDEQMTTEWQCLWVPYQQVVEVPVFDPHHPPSLFWP
jgi:hypothetical protein